MTILLAKHHIIYHKFNSCLIRKKNCEQFCDNKQYYMYFVLVTIMFVMAYRSTVIVGEMCAMMMTEL